MKKIIAGAIISLFAPLMLVFGTTVPAQAVTCSNELVHATTAYFDNQRHKTTAKVFWKYCSQYSGNDYIVVTRLRGAWDFVAGDYVNCDAAMATDGAKFVWYLPDVTITRNVHCENDGFAAANFNISDRYYYAPDYCPTLPNGECRAVVRYSVKHVFMRPYNSDLEVTRGPFYLD